MGASADARLEEQQRPTPRLEVDFPLYLVTFRDGKQKFMSMGEAIAAYTATPKDVTVGGLVLEEDFSVRGLNFDEASKILGLGQGEDSEREEMLLDLHRSMRR